MKQTIREMIAEKRDRILSSQPLSKNDLANIGVELSTLLVNVGDQKVVLENECYQLKKDWIVSEGHSDAKAETFMKADPKWLEFRKTKALYDNTLELIRMIKTKIKDVDNEFENI